MLFSGLLQASIENVVLSPESSLYVTVTVRFQNDSPQPWKLEQLVIKWPHGEYASRPSHLAIAPKTSREWKVRIGPAAGDIRELAKDRSKATVEVH